MRVLLLCVALAGCTPDVVSGAYLCGPEQLCPEGQTCNGVDDTCVLASLAEPFFCQPKLNYEPDDSIATAKELLDLKCDGTPFSNQACMDSGDAADWVTFVAPSGCVAVSVQARIAFPVAYEVLALELWDVDANVKLAGDSECPAAADNDNVRRCLDYALVPGKHYAIQVVPTGEGDCGGNCAYNRYSLTVQLPTSG